MSLREWMMCHLPLWLNPLSPWGAKGRPEMPEKHATVSRQQVASLRLDRLEQLRAQGRLERYRERWREP